MDQYKSFHQKVEDSEQGDSPIYLGIKYLGIVGGQIYAVTQASREGLRFRGYALLIWLNELVALYNLIEARTKLIGSGKKIKINRYSLDGNQIKKEEVDVEEKDKYDQWFKEIENVIELNSGLQDVNPSAKEYQKRKYKVDRAIITELNKCHRELLKDADSRHLLMPEGQQDIKAGVKAEWIDREETKSFSKEI